VYLELFAQTGVVDPVAAQNAYYAYWAQGGTCSNPNKCYFDNSTKNFVANMNAGLRYGAAVYLSFFFFSIFDFVSCVRILYVL
jgi:hypothetical protein